MRFRNATYADKVSIMNLYDETRRVGKISGSCDWNDDYPNEQILDIDYQEQGIFVLEDNNLIIAAVSLLKTDDLDNEPVGWINKKSCVLARLCVSSEYQHKGIGKKVMQEVIHYARERGYESLRLLASIHNLPANKLYQRLKFINKGKVHLYNHEYAAYEYIIKE